MAADRVTELFPWLMSFLARRSLERPLEGHALFRYRCSGDEFKALPSAIEEGLGRYRDDGENAWYGNGALICLYVAEWWRRHYEKGTWRWAGPLDALGGQAKELPAERRNQLVQEGLVWWKRRLIRNKDDDKEYLGTLAAEGGLPVQLVASGGPSRVRNFLKRLVGELARRGPDDLEAIANDRADCLAYGSRHRDLLPLTLRASQPLVEMGAELAARIVLLDIEVQRHRPVRLQAQVPTEEAWRESLEEVPVWKSRLPIEVETEVIWPLVKLLLDQSRVARRHREAEQRGRSGSLGWVWALQKVGSGWRKVRTFEAEGIEGERMAIFCGQKVAAQVKVVASSEEETMQPSKLGHFHPGPGGRWEFEARQPVPSDLWSDDLYLEVEGPGLSRRPAVVAPVGLDGGLPWVFVEEDDRLVLMGQGRCQVATDCAWLSVPEGAKVERFGREAFAQPAREILGLRSPELEHRAWWQVGAGTVRVWVGTERWSVACRSTQSDPAAPGFDGARLSGAADPWPVYLGFPTLKNWKVLVRKDEHWREARRDDSGLLQTRLMRPDGDLVAGPRLHVVPADIKIHARRSGLEIESRELLTVLGGLDVAHDLAKASQQGGRGFVLDRMLPDEGAICRLKLQTRADEQLTIRWATPLTRPAVFGWHDQPIPAAPPSRERDLGPKIPVGRLREYHLRQREGRDLHVRLEAGDEEWWGEWPASSEGPLKVELVALELAALRLLAETGAAAVKADADTRRFQIVPFDDRLQLHERGYQRIVGHRPGEDALAWRLAQPDEERSLKRADSEGREWYIPSDLTPGAWVLQVRDSLRRSEEKPFVWSSPGKALPGAELAQLANLPRESRANRLCERLSALTGLYDEGVGQDLDWLDALLPRLECLPAGSLDVGRALAKTPSVAVAVLLLLRENEDRMLETLQREGLAPCLVGLVDLLAGIHLAWRRLRAITEEVSPNLLAAIGIEPLARAIDREKVNFPALDLAARLWRPEAQRQSEARAWAEAFREAPLSPLVIEHCRAHADTEVETWPQRTRERLDSQTRAVLADLGQEPKASECRRLRQVPEWLARVLVGHDPALTSAQRLRLLAFRDQVPAWFDNQLRLALSLKSFAFHWPEATRPPSRPEAP